MKKNSNKNSLRFLLTLFLVSGFLLAGLSLAFTHEEESPSCGEGKCELWQVPNPDDPLSCIAQGECIATPKNPKYYDNSTYSSRPDRNLGPTGFDGQGLKLPVKLDWDDVPGFKENDLRTMSVADFIIKLPSRVSNRFTIKEILEQLPEKTLLNILAQDIIIKLPLSFLDPFSTSFHQKFLNQMSIDVLNKIPEQELLQAIEALSKKLPPWEVALVPAEIFQGLPRNIIDFLPLKVLERMSPEFLEEVASIRTLSQLPVSSLQQLSINTIKHLPLQSLNKLPISFLRQLPQNHLNQLPLDFVAQLSPAALGQMPVDYLKNLSPHILKKLPLDALEKLPVKNLKSLLEEVAEPLEMEGLEKLDDKIFEKNPDLLALPLNLVLELGDFYRNDLVSLNRQKIADYLIRQFPQNELYRLPLETLNLLPQDFIERLPTSVLEQLPIDFLKNQRPSLLTKLTAEFLNRIPSQSLIQLPQEFIALLPKDVLGRLPLYYLKTLRSEILQKLPSDFLINLPAEVLEILPQEFIMNLPGTILNKLPVKVLETLPPSFLITLQPLVLSEMPFEALNNLPFDFLNQMPSGLLGGLPLGIIDYLTALPDSVNLQFLRLAGSNRKAVPEIYIIRIENLKGEEYRQVVTKSEFVPPSACFFEPNTTYRWHVKACADRDESQCGEEATWTFTTSDAPELRWPQDPDWAGEAEANNQKPDSALEWCQQKIEPNKNPPWPRSIKLLFFILEAGREVCHPSLVNQQGLCEPLLILPSLNLPLPEENNIQYPLPKFPAREYDSQIFTDFFTKNTVYSWQISVCKDPQAQDCTDWSQKWQFAPRFFIKPADFTPDLLNDPWGEKPVGLPLTLVWETKTGANSVVWEIEGTDIKDTGVFPLQRPAYDYPQLSLNTIYSWRIKPCWDYAGKACEDFPPRYWYFKTTGQPPKQKSLYPQTNDIPIPAVFDWQDVGGAKSYVLEIKGPDWEKNETLLRGQTFSLDHPDLKQETQYSWRIKTCADPRAEICGDWTETAQFTTFRLSAPKTPSPQDKEEIFAHQMPKSFSWQNVPYAKYYKYSITYLERSLGESEQCQAGPIVTEKIINRPSDLLSLNCAGEYQWQVAGCLDENCQEQGTVSLWSFTLSPEIKEAGFKTCGLRFNDPKTPWDERENCQAKNIFLTIKIIFDFLFLTIIPLALILLLIDSGIMFYLKKQGLNTLVRIKLIWLKTLKWLLFVLLVWALVALILPVLGYPIGFWSPWP